MILIDDIGHLVSDTCEEELHRFALRLGLRREWYQNKKLPHYDVTTVRMRDKAKKLGAKLVSSKEIVQALKGANLYEETSTF